MYIGGIYYEHDNHFEFLGFADAECAYDAAEDIIANLSESKKEKLIESNNNLYVYKIDDPFEILLKPDITIEYLKYQPEKVTQEAEQNRTYKPKGRKNDESCS